MKTLFITLAVLSATACSMVKPCNTNSILTERQSYLPMGKERLPRFIANHRYRVVTQGLDVHHEKTLLSEQIVVHALSVKYQQMVVSFSSEKQMQWLLNQPYVLSLLAVSQRQNR